MKKSTIINSLNSYFDKFGTPRIIKDFSIDDDLKIYVTNITKSGRRSPSKEHIIWINTDPIELSHTIEDEEGDPTSLVYPIWEELKIALSILGVNYDNFFFELNKIKLGNELPFEEFIDENRNKIRVFSENTDERELKWHVDNEDRAVKSLHKTGWMIQFDNELPKILEEGKEFLIPKGLYHRVIKGRGDLKVSIKFL
jgi:hypothetical protein